MIHKDLFILQFLRILVYFRSSRMERKPNKSIVITPLSSISVNRSQCYLSLTKTNIDIVARDP